MSEQLSGDKFRLTDESRMIAGVRVYRIQALRDFDIEVPGVRKRVVAGERGGFVMHERNLSQMGSAWISDNACVIQYALVTDKALVQGNAQVRNWSQVRGQSRVYGSAVVGDHLVVSDAVLSKSTWLNDRDLNAYRQFTQDIYSISRTNASRIARLAMSHLHDQSDALGQWREALLELKPDQSWNRQSIAALSQCLENSANLLRLRQVMSERIGQMRLLLDSAYGAQLREHAKQLIVQVHQADECVDALLEAVHYHQKLRLAGLDELDLSAMLRQPYAGSELFDNTPCH